MQLTLTRDAEEFAARAGAFLAERVERNVLATVLINARDGVYGEAPPLFAYGVGRAGEVRYAALRTPPWPLLTSAAEELDAQELIGRWLAEDADLPGLSGEPRPAEALAHAWERATGGRCSVRMRLALHTLVEVLAPGRLRLAEPSERGLLLAWESAFARDAHVALSPSLEPLIDSRLAAGAQFLWDAGGPVSTLVVSPEVAGTVRIGPVYTPPEHRTHGYATSAVAAVCRRILESGAERCALFTDLANPTSNRIYASVGFARVTEWKEYAFAG